MRFYLFLFFNYTYDRTTDDESVVDARNRFKFFNPLGANQNTPPDDPEILQRGPEKLNQKSTGSK